MEIAGGRARWMRQGVARLVLAAFVVALLMGSLPARPAAAADWSPPRTVFVPEAGHTVAGLFLDLWREQHEILGNPISEEFQSRSGYANTPGAQRIVQFFENAALVYLPDEVPERQVQWLDLGQQEVERLRELGNGSLPRTAGAAACPPDADCVAVEASGRTVRGKFLAFWSETGEARWLGQPLTEAFRAADGTYVQYFERGALRLDRSGAVAPLPLGLAVAKRQKLDLKPIAQPEGIPVYDEALFVAPPEPEPAAPESVEPDAAWIPGAFSTAWTVGTFGPGPQAGTYKEVVVSLSKQAMWAYENGELVVSSYVSTGTAETPEVETPIGYWTILTKYDVQDMQGTINGESYFVPAVPDVMYFDNLGNALHGTYWHSNFGTPMSHGCVNLPLEVASFLYDWAPIGTSVVVIP